MIRLIVNLYEGFLEIIEDIKSQLFVFNKKSKSEPKIEAPPYCTDPIGNFVPELGEEDEVKTIREKENKMIKIIRATDLEKRDDNMRNETHVTYNKEGKNWVVKKAGSDEVLASSRLKVDTVKLARAISKKEKSELVIHNRDGKIGKKDSHGNDPRGNG